MRFVPPGRHRSVEEFRTHLRALDPEMDCDGVLRGAAGALGQPIQVCGRTLRNRFAVQPMEGWDGTPAGLPGELTRRRWRRFGRSGAELVWGGEACAVRADGRANPHQLCLESAPEAAAGLAALREELRAGRRELGEDPDALCTGLQLTHSGRYALAPRPAARHPLLDARFAGAPPPLLSDGELEAIGEAFVRAAALAWNAGFQFVDVKCCHGYLLHELLGARARPGPYGGTLENRTRLLRRILAGIRRDCPGLEVGVRVSLADALPQGFGVDSADPQRFDLEEPLAFLELLRAGGVRLVNVTLGSPYYCPHLQRPAAYPPSDGYEPPRDPLVEVIAHLKAVRAVRRAFPDLVLVGSGYSYLQEYLPHVAQHEVERGHVHFAGLGRMMLAYPELPADVLNGRTPDRRRICRTFSDCTSGPRMGLPSGCYPLDPDYRARPEAERLRAFKEQHMRAHGEARQRAPEDPRR